MNWQAQYQHKTSTVAYWLSSQRAACTHTDNTNLSPPSCPSWLAGLSWSSRSEQKHGLILSPHWNQTSAVVEGGRWCSAGSQGYSRWGCHGEWGIWVCWEPTVCPHQLFCQCCCHVGRAWWGREAPRHTVTYNSAKVYAVMIRCWCFLCVFYTPSQSVTYVKNTVSYVAY